MHALDKGGAVIYGTKYRILIIKMTKKSFFLKKFFTIFIYEGN